MRPRAWRSSATRRWILSDERVDVLAEPLPIDSRRTGEGCDRSFGRNEEPIPERDQLANRHPVSSDHEAFPPIQGTHDFPALVAELSLGYIPHVFKRSTRATYRSNGGLKQDRDRQEMRRTMEEVESAEIAAEAARLLRDLLRLERDARALIARSKEDAGTAREEAAAQDPGGFEGLTLHEAARRVLAAAGTPLHVRDLGARIKSAGWRHPRSRHAREDQIEYQLAARLPRHPHVFRKVAPNTFGLVEWAETSVSPQRKPRLGIAAGKGPPVARRIGDEPEMIFEKRRKWRSS